MEFPADAEWLEADGRGGFASGTVGLVRTRRYHALLLAAVPPARRIVLVNGMEVWATTAHGSFPLSSQAYTDGTVFPDGACYLADFTEVSWPCWRFSLPGGTTVTQEIFVSRDTGETVLRWASTDPVRLSVRPLLSGRDYHNLHHENPAFDFRTHGGDGVSWQPYPDLPVIHAAGNFAWTDDPVWYRRFHYAAEAARGLDAEEDLASPGTFTIDLDPSGPAGVLILRAGAPASAGPASSAPALMDAEHRRRTSDDPAAASYLATVDGRPGIIAGFPWFGVWGRDTFIAMRGLLLTRGRLADAAAILLAWAGLVSEGMLPNRIPDGADAPEYNSVDASLWFIIVVHELIEAGGAAPATAQRLRSAAIAILDGYTAGTRFGIGLDPRDGLLRAGVPGMQLTWMDAKIGDWVVTPRIGKPVEIQALWINALAIAGQWPDGSRWVGPALRARDSFLAGFFDRTSGGLADVLDDGGVPGAVNRQIRPNQILAAGGLPIPVLTPILAQRVVATVERELFTPIGLRTLSPADPAYCGHYAGNPRQRDGAYHQGTAWPWLMGPFVAAWLKVHGDTAEARAEARTRFLPPLHAHLLSAGIGHVSEVADGDPPHTPGGCPFQAWSMGELIRIEAMLKDPTHG